MKLCRFNTNRLGLLDRAEIIDVTWVLSDLSAERWVRSIEDPVIANLSNFFERLITLKESGKRYAVDSVTFEAPVALPSKIIGAPVNYHEHMDEALKDKALHQGQKIQPIDQIGCFLKASSALLGHRGKIRLPKNQGRVDHEAEIAVIIGKPGRNISKANALEHIAGYSLALDMTVRGKQDRSMRKSCDGFAVLGPWLVTSDEISDPHDLSFTLTVDGELRQHSNTKLLIRNIPELIEMCSSFYTLLPGDVIMTGTPSGVGPVEAGNTIQVSSENFGTLEVSIQ